MAKASRNSDAIPWGQWQRHDEAAEAYFRTKARGDSRPVRNTGGDSNFVKVLNNSGADRRKGEILGLASYLLDSDQLDQDMLWLDGGPPIASPGFGVLRRAIPSDDIDDAQVSGTCMALVNVLDSSHHFAKVVSGYVLESATSGPVGIIYKPGTGEQKCIVVLPVGSTSQPEETGIPFFNGDSLPMMPYQPMMPGGTIDIDGVEHVYVTNNFTGNFCGLWLINGGETVPAWVPSSDFSTAAGVGSWRIEDTGPVALHEAYFSSIEPGMELGPMPVLQVLELNRVGFIALGEGRLIDGQAVVDCQQHPVRTLLGKARVFDYDTQATYVIQNQLRSKQAQFDIWHRVGGQMYHAGWNPLTVSLPFLNSGDRLRHLTWGRADFTSGKWEGDFACDPDPIDLGQGGQLQGLDQWQMPDLDIIDGGQQQLIDQIQQGII